MKIFLYWLFGKRKEGEKLNTPSFHTKFPEIQLSFNDWCKAIRKEQSC